MNMQVRSLLISLTVLVLGIDGYAEVPDQASYENIFSSVMIRVNDVYKTQHLPVLTYDPKRLSFTAAPDQTWRTSVVQVVSTSGIHATILPTSHEMVSFQRDFPAEEYIDYDVAPKPTWTPDQAVGKAQKWVKAVLGRLPDNMGESRAEYTPLLNLPKYHEGTWAICWPRIDSQGHRFMQDVVNVTLSEKFGLIALACIFESKYKDGQKIVVSHDQAIEIGRPVAQKLLTGPLTADWSGGLKLRPTATAELWIINPNHLLQYKSIEEVASAGDDKVARLAWVVEYRAENDKGMGRAVYVWVDTETKEILGGDFRG